MIVGHEQVFAWFAQGLKNRRLSHGYLFQGPRHVGKATAARALAGRIACEHRNVAAPPCGTCAGCAAFAADWRILAPSADNESSKLGEIGIREARDLRRFLALKPFGQHRFALIDDAEQLTVEAANTLLKSLEEPPASALIFVVCHEPSRLLETIRSRLVSVQFSPVPRTKIIHALLAADASRGDAESLSRQAGGRVGLALRWFADVGYRDSTAKFRAVMLEPNPLRRNKLLVSMADSTGEQIREFLEGGEMACRDALITALGLPDRAFRPDKAGALERFAASRGLKSLARLAATVSILKNRFAESALNPKVAFDLIGAYLS
ncbi:hypothetical protein HYW67_04350 [Candidatus Parcubacteria bacterium]|nr:hypothetical protein [Candidatus Parcubacteria bacterium]